MIKIILGFVMSFFIAGLGITYAGNLTQGIGIMLLWSILTLISLFGEGLTSMITGSTALCI